MRPTVTGKGPGVGVQRAWRWGVCTGPGAVSVHPWLGGSDRSQIGSENLRALEGR